MRRSPLKRKKIKRHVSSVDMADLKTKVALRDKGICIGIRAGIEHACKFPVDPEHLVEQRQIVRYLGEGSPALTDERLVTYCCRWLNGALHDYHYLKLATDLKRSDLTNLEKDERARASIRRHAPEGFEEAVKEYKLEIPAEQKLGRRA